MNKKMLLILASTFLMARSSSAETFIHHFFQEFDDLEKKLHQELNDLENRLYKVKTYKDEKAQKFLVQVDLPGVEKKDIKVTIDNKHGILTITAASKVEKTEEEKNEQNVSVQRSKSFAQSSLARQSLFQAV